MKINLICSRCVRDVTATEPFYARGYLLPFNTTGLYRFTCSAGHDVRTIVQQLRYEVLAETGMQALVDGYYRDSVVSFYASLERFMEFFCQVVSMAHGVEPTAIETTRKAVSRQSERQLGMFLGFYHLETGEPSTVTSNSFRDKVTNVRNDVVHNGRIPTFDEAISFAQEVVNTVQPIIAMMLSRYVGEISSVIHDHQVRALSNLPPEDRHEVSFSSIPLIYDLTEVASVEPKNVRAEIARRLQRKGIA